MESNAAHFLIMFSNRLLAVPLVRQDLGSAPLLYFVRGSFSNMEEPPALRF